ncbi:MAG: ADYC domain-containing protein [Gammaproteobacteria bacterium]
MARPDVRFGAAALAWLHALCANAAPEVVLAPDLSVEGTALVLKLPHGQELRGAKMQGAAVHLALEDGPITSIKLRSIVPDPEEPAILRHQFDVQNEKGQWISACVPTAAGETWGFPLALPEGHPGREGPITLTCTSGAVGKCVRFGYKPWANGPGGESLLAYHAACVRMVRADYCGDGAGHTKDGTIIDFYDRLGIEKSDSGNDPEFAFEAGWAPGGAACVARTRWADLATLEQLAARCPELPRGPQCTGAAARKADALLFNRSRLAPRIGE